MKLITFFARANALKSAIENPRKAGWEAILGYLQGYAFVIAGYVLLPLLAFGILGFTSLIGGPYTFFAVLFWILLGLEVFVIIALWVGYRKLKQSFTQKLDRLRQRRAVDVEVVDQGSNSKTKDFNNKRHS